MNLHAVFCDYIGIIINNGRNVFLDCDLTVLNLIHFSIFKKKSKIY